MTEFTLSAHEILYEWDENYLNLLNGSDKYRYIDIGVVNPKYFSYIPKHKVKQFEDGELIRNKCAVEIKPTRLMNKILKDPITTEQSERLLGIIGRYDNYKFKVIEREELVKYYSSECIETPTAMLENSCMMDKPEEYFKLYVDKAKLIILQNPITSKIIGRALLWKATLDNIEIDFMDRVYADTIPSAKFKKYAIDNNFYMRHSDNKYTFYYKDKKYLTQEVDLRLNVDIRNYKYVPFMDTFCIHRKGYMASVDFYNWMQNTNGGFVYCSKCGEQIDEYAGFYYSRYDFENKEDVIYCKECLEKYTVIIKGKKYKVDNKHIRYCWSCKSWHLEVDTVNYSMCKECWDKLYVKINGRKYSKKGKKVYYNEEKGEWLLK